MTTEYVEAFDVWITQLKMPMRVRAFCKVVGDARCIVLNSDLAAETKRCAVLHEVTHLKRNDLDSDLSVAQIEGQQ